MLDPSGWQRRTFGTSVNELRRVVDGLIRAASPLGESDEHPDAKRLRGQARRLEGCSRHPSLAWDRAAGQLRVLHHRCRSRLCPRCGKWRAREVSARLDRLAAKLDSPRLMTLTLKSSDRPLRDQVRHLTESLRTLRRTRAWRDRVRGGVWVMEVTWSQTRQQWHPHLHLLTEGSYYPQRELSRDWAAASGGSTICDVRACHSRRQAVIYLTQYLSKSQDASHVPTHRLGEWCLGMHGVRMAQTWGSLHGLALDAAAEQSPADLEPVGSLSAIVEDADRGRQVACDLLDAIMQSMAGQGDLTPEHVRDWAAKYLEDRAGPPPPLTARDRPRPRAPVPEPLLW